MGSLAVSRPAPAGGACGLLLGLWALLLGLGLACSGAFAGLAGFVSGLGLWVGDLVGLWALFLACGLWALLPGLCWALVGACDFVGAWAFAVLVGACKRVC